MGFIRVSQTGNERTRWTGRSEEDVRQECLTHAMKRQDLARRWQGPLSAAVRLGQATVALGFRFYQMLPEMSFR